MHTGTMLFMLTAFVAAALLLTGLAGSSAQGMPFGFGSAYGPGAMMPAYSPSGMVGGYGPGLIGRGNLPFDSLKPPGRK